MQAQCLVAIPPLMACQSSSAPGLGGRTHAIAYPRFLLDDQMGYTEILESRGDFKAGVAGTNHDHGWITVNEINFSAPSLFPSAMFGSFSAERTDLHLESASQHSTAASARHLLGEIIEGV